MLTRLADLAFSRPKRVLAVTAVFLVVAGVVGGPVAGLLSTGDDFSDPGSESHRTAERITAATGSDTAPGVVVLLDAGQAVRSPAVRARVERIAAELRASAAIARVVTFFDRRDPTFVSRDGRSTYLAVFIRAEAPADEVAEAIAARLEARPGITVGGQAISGPAVGKQVQEDLARAELLAFPILLLLSLLVFRSVVAALLPLFVGMLTVMGTFLGLRLVNEVEPLSIFALNLATGLGLGLAIDYSLFVVSRYREELARGGSGREVLRRTMRSAGRTVTFSGLTVAAALLALLVFPQRFLYSMGVSGALVALLAAATSLTALPALLALLGPRVNALSLGRWRRSVEHEARGERRGLWYRLTRGVMRRPLPIAVATAAVLVAAGVPFLSIKFTGVDAGVLPADTAPRQVYDALKAGFPPAPTSPVEVVADAPRAAREDVAAYARELRSLDGVAAVSPPQPLGGDAWRIAVTPEALALDERSLDLVEDVRARGAPFPVAVAGESAAFVDQQDALGDRLPFALALLAVTTLVLLFVMTGSVVLPVKSLVMNLLSLSAAFGLLVLIFQDGRLEGLLGYESQGALESTQPVLLFAVAFALSTDYGVFLLTRIKEARDHGASDDEAVAIGLQRTGRIVTAAALLLSVAIGAFATSEVIFIKQVGVGTVLAVLIDAFVIRALLVPSLMKLLGRWNWWAPRPLRRVYGRIGISEA